MAVLTVSCTLESSVFQLQWTRPRGPLIQWPYFTDERTKAWGT